jgi:tetratricopeptide (TPR) repeat protein
VHLIRIGNQRPVRFIWALTLALVLLVGTTACAGSEGTTGGSSTTAPQPKKAQTALDAGLKAYTAGDLKEAAAEYNTALRYEPGNKFAWYNLGILDEAHTNYGLAETKYRAALKTDAAYEPALFNLAILRTRSDPQEAISLYRGAVAAEPKDADAWLNLGLLLRQNGQKPAGDKAVLHAILLDPKLKDPTRTTSP